MKPIQKLIGGVWELYLALGYDDIPSLAVERHRSRGGGTTYFRPHSFHATLIGIMLKSRFQRWHGALVPPPRSAAHGYLNIPSLVVLNKF